jgi:hypothetical protein
MPNATRWTCCAPLLGLLTALGASAPALAACPDGPCITYTRDEQPGVPRRTVHRIEAIEGAAPENVSLRFDQLDPLRAGGADQQLGMSPNGQWLVLTTEHFDARCAGAGGCLGVVPGDLSGGEALGFNGDVITPEGIAAIASTGRLVVFPDNDRTAAGHVVDLFAMRRAAPGEPWGAPRRLTTASTFVNHSQPAISADGRKVVFNCSNQLDASAASICEVNTDGTGFHQVLTPADLPDTTPNQTLGIVDYAPDGGLVLENEQEILRLPAGAPATAAFVINRSYGNDVSPCVLPGGHVVSLWLNRPENSASVHELKVMNSAGKYLFTLNALQETFDVGIGCGGPPVRCRGKDVTLLGTEFSNALNGTARDDVISGLGGRDVIAGGAGDDTICGGNGGDDIRGGPGSDLLAGDGGNDTLAGGDDDDVLLGGNGDDTLSGDAGTDHCDGGAGTNSLQACEP